MLSLAVVLPLGCSSPQPVAGAPEQIDGGVQITVPVLWADPASGASGVEPALVWAGDDAVTDFRIDLRDLEAKGAGAAWQAASATAAAVGSLYSGLDPRDVDVSFSVTGPIDGPSAGAALTVGVLAALRGDALLPGVTMTGAVSPDGTISRVGGVGLKLAAAKEAGYSTVLLPPGNATLQVSGSNETISAVDAGNDLGLDVRHVSTVAEAYQLLTGMPLTPGADVPYVLPASVRDAGAQTARDLIANTAELVAQIPADAAKRPVLIEGLARSEEFLAAGDAASAYALAVEALLVAGRVTTVHRYGSVIDAKGLQAARDLLTDEAKTAVAEAEAALLEGSDIDGLGMEQVVSLPTALAWSAYARATLQGLASSVLGLDTREGILAGAAVLSEARDSIALLQPDALEVIRAMPSQPLPSKDWAAEYLSGYTMFLARAGEANADYIAEVVLPSIPSASVGTDDVRSLAPVLDQSRLAREALSTATEATPREIQDAAIAITDFVSTGMFIAATQEAGITGFNLVSDAPTITDASSVQASIDSLLGVISGASSQAAARGLDAGYPVWSAEWGSAAFAELSQQDRLGAGAVLAFSELAYDAVALQMLLASSLDQRQAAAL
jgi:hypothetical protein